MRYRVCKCLHGKSIKTCPNMAFLVNAKSSRPTLLSSVPFRRDPDFVDCDVLSEMKEKCSSAASRVALVGLGGVG